MQHSRGPRGAKGVLPHASRAVSVGAALERSAAEGLMGAIIGARLVGNAKTIEGKQPRAVVYDQEDVVTSWPN